MPNRTVFTELELRNKKVARPTVGPLLVNQTLTDDPTSMANSFVRAFASVFLVPDVINPFPHQQCDVSISSVDITIEDVEAQLKSLKADSAMGPDNLHPLLLKECSSVLAYPFYLLFNQSLRLGVVPSAWKSSLVTPIFKKGSRTDPLNYRPISLSPIPCKSLERIITKSLHIFINENNLLDNAQFGFRPGSFYSHMTP